MEQINLKNKRKMKNCLYLSFIILSLLAIRIGYLQFIKGIKLQELAYEQQVQKRKINSKRGTIYDASKKYILAESSTVYTVTVNPTNIAKKDKEKVAKAMCDIFDLKIENVIKKIEKRSSIENIIKKIDKDKADELRNWLMENNIKSGVNIDEDCKRYYPFSNLASQVIGFCGSDNQGLDGVERVYDEVLSGMPGAISKTTDATGKELGTEGEEYTKAIDGNSIVLSIDMTIESIVEKYLEEACIDNICTDGGNIVVMNPKNGDILAIAGYPNYNLNEPYEPNTDELKDIWGSLSQNEKNEKLQGMWRNKAISDTYEPGSTFKLITASAALEEGITQTDKEGEFCCTGYIDVAGVKIRCWRYYRPHGSESLRDALMNSCNPVFIGLGQKLGVSKYYEYLKKFGYLGITGIDLPGEAKGIFLAENKVRTC